MAKRMLLSAVMVLTMAMVHSGFAWAVDPFIAESSENGIRYFSGGVGQDERELILQTRKNFDFKAVFALKSGAYLADVQLSVWDANGRKLLDSSANGPWFYAELPPGTYKIVAVFRKDMKSRTVQVGSGLKTVMFHWNPAGEN